MTADVPPPAGQASGQAADQSPEQPWSPFPVQDWSTMPPLDPYQDNLWLDPGRRDDPVVHEADGAGARTDRAGGASSAPRRWVPSLVVLLAFALAAGGLWAVAHVSRGTEPPSSAFLPADGVSWYADVDRGSATPHLQTFNESARLGALEATQSVAFNFGSNLLGSLGTTEGSELGAAQAWRVTSTEIGPGAARSQRTRVYRTDHGVELMAESGPDGAEVYTPALRELPADPHPGDHWQSSGVTHEGTNYLSDFTAAAGVEGCLDVRGSIAFSGATAGDGREVAIERTWCPGRGLTRTSERVGGAAVTEVIEEPSPPLPGARDVDLTAQPVRWLTPTAWTARTTQIHAADPQFGDAALSAQPSPVPPVVTASSQLIRAVTQGSDLLVMSPPSALDDNWQVVRRLHPGGAVTMLASFGDLVLVGTTQRVVVAYGPDGQRVWQQQLNDLVGTVPARTGDAVAVVSASGELRVIDLSSGLTRWRIDRRADVNTATAADDSTVLLADRSGALTAFAASDGAELWQVDTESAVAAMIITGDRVQVVDGSNLDTRALTDATLRSRHPVPGTYRALRAVGDVAVLASTSVTQGVDADGKLAWTGPGYQALTTDGDTMLAWRDTGADVLDDRGRVRVSYQLGPTRKSENRQYVRYRQGVLVVSTVYNDIQVWS